MRLFRLLALSSVIAAFAVGCGDSDSCISGSGPSVSQTIDLSAFTGFDFQAAGDVTVTEGATQQVMVRAQQNVIDVLNRDVLNGFWRIGFTQCVRDTGDVRVEITLPVLDGIELSGAGTIDAETQAGTVDTILSGAGTVTVFGQATTHEISLEGSGTVEAFDLVTNETTVVLTGQGNVAVRAEEQLNVDLLGVGTVSYKGDPQLNVRITGAGTVTDAN